MQAQHQLSIKNKKNLWKNINVFKTNNSTNNNANNTVLNKNEINKHKSEQKKQKKI